MPAPTREGGLPPEVKQMDDEKHQATVQSVGDAAPMAEQPLPAAKVDDLVDALNQAKSALSGGELPELAPVGADVEQLPPEVFADLTTMSMALERLQQSGLQTKKYAYNPVEAASSVAGLTMATAKLRALAQDDAIVEALNAGAPTEEPEEPTEEPESKPEKGKRDLEGLM